MEFGVMMLQRVTPGVIVQILDRYTPLNRSGMWLLMVMMGLRAPGLRGPKATHNCAPLLPGLACLVTLQDQGFCFLQICIRSDQYFQIPSAIVANLSYVPGES